MRHLALKPFAYATVAALALTACGQKAAENSASAPAAPAATGPGVWAAGSSTVFPFASRVAEQVARTTGGATPKVESLGTGGGFKIFCSSAGSSAPDIANASRPMKKSEWDACKAAGVGDIVEIKFGYDGIVIANAKSEPSFDFSRLDLYKGLAAEVDGKPNAAKTWKDVNPALSAEKITVYGPPPTSGTRDAFAELALEAGATKVPALADLKKSDEKAFKAKAQGIRQDGAWIDAGENDNAIVQTLTKTPGSLGVFGYSFLENNADKVKAAKVEGVDPTLENISSGKYPLSRSLYIYVKKDNIAVKPALKAFVQAFASDAAAGRGGYLQDRGLIPLHPEDHEAMKKLVNDLTPMAPPAS